MSYKLVHKNILSIKADAIVSAANTKLITDAVKTLPFANQGDYTDELVRLKQLCDSGVITEEEFAIKKRQLLGI